MPKVPSSQHGRLKCPTNDKIGPKGQYDCQDCSHSFTNSNALRHHRRIHPKTEKLDLAEKLVHVCPDCTELFPSQRAQKDHAKQSHPTGDIELFNRKNPFACSECTYRCATERSLKLHVTKKHQNMIPQAATQWSCDVCHKSFPSASTWLYHSKRAHVSHYDSEGDALREVQCHHCEKKFHSQRGLRHHMGKNHADFNLTWVCEVCEDDFETQQLLAEHSPVHLVSEQDGDQDESDES